MSSALERSMASLEVHMYMYKSSHWHCFFGSFSLLSINDGNVLYCVGGYMVSYHTGRQPSVCA